MALESSAAAVPAPPAPASHQDLLASAFQASAEFLRGLSRRPVGASANFEDLVDRMGGPLPAGGEDAVQVLRQMVESADPGVVATAGPRYFGFVIGGSLPVAAAADWLVSVWDQNSFSNVSSPASAAAEEVVRQWLLELFGLPPHMSLGLTTGATMASFTGLAAARNALLRSMNWNVETQGLFHAPPFTVVTGEESHQTIFFALQLLGLGRDRVVKVATDEQGRMRPDALRGVLAEITTPFVVCAQAGNVDTGAFDPLVEIAEVIGGRGWLHVDGAFGIWAAASSEYRHLLAGMERADSITADAHKWLNVPYDCGLVFVKDIHAHRGAMTLYAPYYTPDERGARDNFNWVPEQSRRARAFPVYAVLRTLGRSGVAEIVERCCRLARRMAGRLAAQPGVKILNDVVINQVLVRFTDPAGGDSDRYTLEVIRRIQQDSTCWLGSTTWHGMVAARISVSNWSTTEADIDLSAEAILRCAKPSEAQQ